MIALAARTPVGLTAESSAAAVRAGISRIVLHPFMADWESENVRGAIDGLLDPSLLGWQRLAALAGGALAEITEKLAATPLGAATPRVFLALPEPRPGIIQADERLLVTELEAAQAKAGRPIQVTLLGRGHAGGLEGLAKAGAEIRAGSDDIYIVGGVDSYFDFDTLDWLQEHRQLQTEETRGGFFPGEAAGFVALVGDRIVRRHKLATFGSLSSWGLAIERKRIKTEDINLGEGLAQALAEAMAGLGGRPEAVHDVYCDINGERFRSEEWGFALLRVPQAVQTQDYTAPVDCWGDVGSASGPLFCILAARAWARRYAGGRRALVWAGSEAGARAAVFLDAPADR